MENLFVYGTLLFREVVEKITGKNFVMVPAVLNGYRRVALEGAFYPALVEARGEVVYGKVLLDVDAHSMNLIAAYEGDEYLAEKVVVDHEHNPLEALVFVWRESHESLKTTDWDEQEFYSQLIRNGFTF